MATKNSGTEINSGTEVNRKNSMAEMPQICLGTVLQSNNNNYLKTKFKEAINHGYNHIDSAQYYHNMNIMPEVIQHGINKYGRAGFWITWKYMDINEGQIKFDLKKLDCDYFDLVLLHFPSNINSNKSKMNILIKLKNAGLIKHIGVSNYEDPDDLIELNNYLKSNGYCIYANQIQARPISSDAEVINGRYNPNYDRLLDVCRLNNIKLMLFSPYSALMKSMGKKIIKNEDMEIINEIISNPDFGKKVISYYTRQYLVGQKNVLMNGISSGANCLQNYDTINSILNDGLHTNLNEKNNANVFKKITKLKLSNMSQL